jgi:hypothetical protein
LKSLEKVAKEEALKRRPYGPDDIIPCYSHIEINPNNVKLPATLHLC